MSEMALYMLMPIVVRWYNFQWPWLIPTAPVLMAVIVSSKWCDSSIKQFVNDSWVLDLTRPTTTAKKAKTSRVNKMANIIA